MRNLIHWSDPIQTRCRAIALVLGAVLMAGVQLACAQAGAEPASSGTAIAPPVAVAPAPANPPAAAPPVYMPSMGDLMTMAVQPRHTKLGLAGQARNWAYAAYEVSELRNAFARIARTIPLYNKADTAALVAAFVQAPLQALAEAIQTHDATQFDRKYAALTAACNACHGSQNHGSVVIRVPRQSAYPDQDLRAPR